MNNRISSVPSTSLVVLPQANAQAVQTHSSHYIPGAPYGPESEAAAQSGEGILEYLRLLSRYKGAIILSALGGLLLGLAIGVPMTPVYRAHAAVEILGENQDFMNMKQTAPTTTSEYSDDVSEEETQSQMVQGSALMTQVVRVLDPNSADRGEPPLATTGWRSWFHMPVDIELTARQRLIVAGIKSLKVRVAPHTRLLDITSDSTDAAFAATFVNTLVQEFIKRNIELRYATTKRTGEWLGKEISDATGNLRKSEANLQAYARSSGLIFTDSEQETNVATEKLQQLQQSLSGATVDRTAKQARYELAKTASVDSLGDVLSDDGLQQLAARISAVSEQLADLNSVYSPEYSKVKRTEAQLQSLQMAFDKQRLVVVKKIENDYRTAADNEKLLDEAYVAQEHEVNGQDEKTIQYNILKREVDSNRQLYDTMLLQMKQASIASALHAANVRISDPADLPGLPIFPNHKLDAALGMMLGTIVCIGIVTARERADRTLQMPGEIKHRVGLAELGCIPSSTGAAKHFVDGPASTKSLQRSSSRQEVQISQQVALATFQYKSSLIAEAFRSCLTSILFAGDTEILPKVLVFTSTQAGDGKTTVVANLGIALAEIRTRTLIIDADMRRPTLQRVFNVPNTRGLSDMLKGEPTDENFTDLIQQTDVPGLHLLPAGPPSSAAAHLLHSPNFLEFLNRARPEYDMILIDTPPMLQMTDARVIGRLSDAAVLVARAGVTTRDALIAAKERLEEDHTPILGSILNSWDINRSTGTYYYQQYKQNQAGAQALARED